MQKQNTNHCHCYCNWKKWEMCYASVFTWNCLLLINYICILFCLTYISPDILEPISEYFSTMLYKTQNLRWISVIFPLLTWTWARSPPWWSPGSPCPRRYLAAPPLHGSQLPGLVADEFHKWPVQSTTCYAMLDFESDRENLQGKYLLIERHILQIQDILLQYLPYKLSISLSKSSIA